MPLQAAIQWLDQEHASKCSTTGRHLRESETPLNVHHAILDEPENARLIQVQILHATEHERDFTDERLARSHRQSPPLLSNHQPSSLIDETS
jgi:hypothetical protein